MANQGGRGGKTCCFGLCAINLKRALLILLGGLTLLLAVLGVLLYVYVSLIAVVLFLVVVALFVCAWIWAKGHAAVGIGPAHHTDLTEPTRHSKGDKAKPIRCVVLSDTHCKHRRIRVPPGDILLHCGDFTIRGTKREIRAFDTWLGTLPHKHKIVLSGNHDLVLDKDFYDADWHKWHRRREVETAGRTVAEQLLTNCTYICDEEVIVEGLKIYGSPLMPDVPGKRMAFGASRRSAALKAAHARIPPDTDILLTHGPPHGMQDRFILGKHVGCRELRQAVDRIRPRFHCFGHIHEAYGVTRTEHTTFINAANCNILYKPLNRPVVFDIFAK